MHEQVPRPSSMPPGREREIFEVLLSNPLLGAAEALALLGMYKDARGVGGAASLDAVRAVSTKQPRLKEAPAMSEAGRIAGGTTRALEYPSVVPQVYGLQSRTRHTRLQISDTAYMYLEREEWLPESAVSVAEGASASIVVNNAPVLVITPADSSSYLLVAISSGCTNVVSLRLDFDCNWHEPSLGPLAAILGELAPNLEVLDLQYLGDAESLRSVLTVLPHLRVLLLEDIFYGAAIYEGGRVQTLNAEHPSLTYIRLPPAMTALRYAQSELLSAPFGPDVNRVYEVVKGLLASCPALRVLDFTAFGETPPAHFLHDIKENVNRDGDGAGRLTHVFARRTYDFDLHEYVVILLEEEEEEEDWGEDEEDLEEPMAAPQAELAEARAGLCTS
jgi:hypothetical protein